MVDRLKSLFFIGGKQRSGLGDELMTKLRGDMVTQCWLPHLKAQAPILKLSERPGGSQTPLPITTRYLCLYKEGKAASKNQMQLPPSYRQRAQLRYLARCKQLPVLFLLMQIKVFPSAFSGLALHPLPTLVALFFIASTLMLPWT